MSKEDTIHFLKQFPVFKDLDPFEMLPIIDFSSSRQYEPGQIIFMQDEPATDVYFIKSGKVKIYRTDYDGKEQIVNMLQKNDMFPHQGLFRKGQYPAHAEISDVPTTLVSIPIASFENFLIAYPEICIKMFRVLGEIIVDLQSRLEQKMLYNITDQIIMLLLRLADRNGQLLDDGMYKINMLFTNRELANMIGSSRETVSRTLTQLKKKDFIYTDDNGYLIIDYVQLEMSVLK